jgi:hypothetical protein
VGEGYFYLVLMKDLEMTCLSESSINIWIENNDGLDRDLYAKYWNTSDEYIDTLKEL